MEFLPEHPWLIPFVYRDLLLLSGLMLALAWYLEWWKKNHK